MRKLKPVQALLSSTVLIVFMIACFGLGPNTANNSESSINLTDVNRTAVPAALTIVAQTVTSLSQSMVIPTSIISIPTSTLDTRPTRTPLPDFEPTQIPSLLKSALTIETLSNFNEHNLQRISGWKHGFYDLEWLDANHLILYPFAGVTGMADTTIAGTYPAVVNLNAEKFWIPNLSHAIVKDRVSFPWSAKLGVLIIPGPNDEISIYSPDGDLRNTYSGRLLGVSPSATKILINDGIWLDLSNGKTVNFAWNQTYPATDFAEYAYSLHYHPIWSSDEMRVYTCCYVYGDARTGTNLVMPYDAITIDGEKSNSLFEVLGGMWVLSDKYVLPIWQGVWDGRYSTIFLFDPAAKTYRNLSKMAGLPGYPGYDSDPYCNRPSAQNGGRYIWVDCVDGSYLIDLISFTSRAYPPFDRLYGEGTFAMPDTYWSADGNFVWFNQEGAESILSGVTGELKLLPKNCGGFEWHPKDNVLICVSNGGTGLLLLDAQTVSVQREAILPTKFYMMGWSPDGEHFALVERENNSVWQIDYPNLDNLKQLTPALPELTRPIPNSNLVESLIKNVVWSPDDSAIAFIGGQDIYIVQK